MRVLIDPLGTVGAQVRVEFSKTDLKRLQATRDLARKIQGEVRDLHKDRTIKEDGIEYGFELDPVKIDAMQKLAQAAETVLTKLITINTDLVK